RDPARLSLHEELKPFAASAFDASQSASTVALPDFSGLRYNRISRSSVQVLSSEQATRRSQDISSSTRLSGSQQMPAPISASSLRPALIVLSCTVWRRNGECFE